MITIKANIGSHGIVIHPDSFLGFVIDRDDNKNILFGIIEGMGKVEFGLVEDFDKTLMKCKETLRKIKNEPDSEYLLSSETGWLVK